MAASSKASEATCNTEYDYCVRTYNVIGAKRMKNVSQSLRRAGPTPRMHGNSKRLPKHTLWFEYKNGVVSFLRTMLPSILWSSLAESLDSTKQISGYSPPAYPIEASGRSIREVSFYEIDG